MNFKHCPQCASTRISMPENRFMRCDDCGYQYFHNVASAVAGIIVCGNQVLINIRAKAPGEGLWDLAGGFVDFNETLEQALSREVKEELGITIENWHYLQSGTNIYHYKTVDYHTADTIFYAVLNEKPQLEWDPVELSDARWVSFDNIDYEKFAFNSLATALKSFLTHK